MVKALVVSGDVEGFLKFLGTRSWKGTHVHVWSKFCGMLWAGEFQDFPCLIAVVRYYAFIYLWEFAIAFQLPMVVSGFVRCCIVLPSLSSPESLSSRVLANNFLHRTGLFNEESSWTLFSYTVLNFVLTESFQTDGVRKLCRYIWLRSWVTWMLALL